MVIECLTPIIIWTNVGSLLVGYWEQISAKSNAKHNNRHKRKLIVISYYVISFVSKCNIQDDVIKWKHFPRYWPFVRGIRWSPVKSPRKGQLRGALIFAVIYAWKRVNNRKVGDLPSIPLLRQCNDIVFNKMHARFHHDLFCCVYIIHNGFMWSTESILDSCNSIYIIIYSCDICCHLFCDSYTIHNGFMWNISSWSRVIYLAIFLRIAYLAPEQQ